MPQPNKAIASSRAELFLVPPEGGEPVLLGVVEDFSCPNSYRSENLNGLGYFAPPDNVCNTVEGRLRWGRVFKTNPAILDTIRPRVSRYAEYAAFDLLVIDPHDKQAIVRCIDVLPETLDVTMTNGRSLRENYSGICRFVQHGTQEILEAA